jgi:outer membrane protein assembly factor BamB
MWDYYLSSPVFHQNNIFIGSGDGFIYCIDPEKGDLIWKYQSGGIVHATPLCTDSLVLTGSFDGYFYALDNNTGALKWKFRTVGESYFPVGEIQCGAVLYNNAVIFGSRDYNLYALNISTGRGLWNMKEKGSWIIATPIVYEDKLFVGTSDSHRFFALNAGNGDELWSIPLNMRVYGSAVLHEGYLYFGCFNGKLYRVNPQTGTYRVVFQTPESKKNYSSIYKTDDTFRDDFQLYGKDMHKNENTILSLGSILSTPVINHDILYFGDANGKFYAVKLNPE